MQYTLTYDTLSHCLEYVGSEDGADRIHIMGIPDGYDATAVFGKGIVSEIADGYADIPAGAYSGGMLQIQLRLQQNDNKFYLLNIILIRGIAC